MSLIGARNSIRSVRQRSVVWPISALAFVAFLARELTAQHPLVDLSVFLNRNFAVGTGLITLLGALFYGTTAILPLFMQNLLGYSATDAGLALSPRGVGAFVAAVLAGRLMGIITRAISSLRASG